MIAITTPPLPLHLGYTGTRHGMSTAQRHAVADLLTAIADIHRVPIVARHGCCVGGDSEFHAECRLHQMHIIGHPGPEWPDGPLCARVLCDEIVDRQPYPVRNRAIVEASDIMIAAPLEMEMQRRGGTWSTIRMAIRALREGKLRELWAVGRNGKLMRHEEWTW